MELAAEQRGEILVVRAMDDRIDAAGAIQFKDQMRELTLAACPRVVLDMSRVAFLDSSGLGAVVAVMKALGPDRKLELASLTTTVQKVFRLTRMDSVFTIHDQVPEDLRQAD
ncbi:MAG: STAS domain-containing protein [Cypionkella sp.]|uniref:STAS domain-containing protein n=1 Tax=Cypionkella sp. TaxID=2811411 RepID=UPI00271743AB|nr:STAS domain-containing protein [Cypionkella sp.]MDO8328427.1 STAS domain-containing protein [Cypionkella sp.]